MYMTFYGSINVFCQLMNYVFIEFRAVANMTPYMPPNPAVNPLKALHAKPGVFQYQLYFHKEVRANNSISDNL